MELFDWTQLVKELLIDQSWHQQETVARDKLIDGLLFYSSGLNVENQKALLKHVRKQQGNRERKNPQRVITCMTSAGFSVFSLNSSMVGAYMLMLNCCWIRVV